jgi:hypothetical protein
VAKNNTKLKERVGSVKGGNIHKTKIKERVGSEKGQKHNKERAEDQRLDWGWGWGGGGGVECRNEPARQSRGIQTMAGF